MQHPVRNRIRCKHCGGMVESRYTHEYVSCRCVTCAVDGGHDYIRRTYTTSSEENFEELSEFEEI